MNKQYLAKSSLSWICRKSHSTHTVLTSLCADASYPRTQKNQRKKQQASEVRATILTELVVNPLFCRLVIIEFRSYYTRCWKRFHFQTQLGKCKNDMYYSHCLSSGSWVGALVHGLSWYCCEDEQIHRR